RFGSNQLSGENFDFEVACVSSVAWSACREDSSKDAPLYPYAAQPNVRTIKQLQYIAETVQRGAPTLVI
ncbi:hypothetical protein FRC19_005220, partial [Serendipita sp. 401]